VKKTLTVLLYVAIIGLMVFVACFRILRSCRQFLP
jgi:Co/Zn/Cd efflux system component